MPESLHTPSDAKVITRSLADPYLFGEIFERYHRLVYGYMVRRVGFDKAEDLASEVFTRAFDNRERFDSTYQSARPWILGISRHVYLNEQRRRYANREFPTDGHGASNTGPDHADAVVDGHVAATVLSDPDLARALAELHPDIRDALLMFAVDEMTYQEIADTLDIPLGTVRSRLGRARRHLREQTNHDARTEAEGGDDE